MEMTVTVSQLILDAARAKLPEVAGMIIDGQTKWEGHGRGKVAYVLKGKLPSGLVYDVCLDLGDDRAAWLNDGELLREVDRAVQVFKVAIALAGEPTKRRGFSGALDAQHPGWDGFESTGL